MKLYWGPHTCAIGIHILLEEVGARYETCQIDVAGGATHHAEFLAINPKGKVPTMVLDDGSILTEFGAIATWLGRNYPAAKLLPEGRVAEARATEMLEYVEGTVHGQGFARLFQPENYDPTGNGKSQVESQGKDIINKAFAIIDRQLEGRKYAAGDTFSVADAALFYVERWAPQKDVALPTRVEAHFKGMLTRPSVQKVRRLWGEA
jgi:glutathione S-transferase